MIRRKQLANSFYILKNVRSLILFNFIFWARCFWAPLHWRVEFISTPALPHVDDFIDRLHNGVYFASLDMRSGYYQNAISEKSKKYTSFITHKVQYKLNRVGFGLTNASYFF